jgi:hypothetical protein
LGLAGAAALAQGCARWPWESSGPGNASDLDSLAAALVDGGQRSEGIPAIDSPDYETAGGPVLPRTTFITPHVGEYEDGDVVDALVSAGGVPRAYPRFITVWHEVVNETFAGEPVSITYCPLTGSTLAFSGRLAGGQTTFGVSGRILNSNLVMVDRDTLSLWPQLLGVAIEGRRKGERLRQLPLPVTTTLGRWRARYPNTLVLSTLTGRLRPYRTWPYGNDYDRNATIIFPLTARDERLPPKRIVYGVGGPEGAAALEKEAALRRGVTMVDLGGDHLVAIADEELQVVRVFRANADGKRLTFHARRPGGAFDDETGSRWSYMGIAQAGPMGTVRLEQVPAPEVFWFAWYAFHPGTRLIV